MPFRTLESREKTRGNGGSLPASGNRPPGLRCGTGLNGTDVRQGEEQMFTYDALRRALSDWPWLRRSVVFVVVTLGLAVLYAIVLTAVAYYQDGVIAGYAFGQNIHLPRNAIIMVEEECTTLPGWVPYAKAAGRMPIGAGTGSDINNVARIFRVQ